MKDIKLEKSNVQYIDTPLVTKGKEDSYAPTYKVAVAVMNQSDFFIATITNLELSLPTTTVRPDENPSNALSRILRRNFKAIGTDYEINQFAIYKDVVKNERTVFFKVVVPSNSGLLNKCTGEVPPGTYTGSHVLLAPTSLPSVLNESIEVKLLLQTLIEPTDLISSVLIAKELDLVRFSGPLVQAMYVLSHFGIDLKDDYENFLKTDSVTDYLLKLAATPELLSYTNRPFDDLAKATRLFRLFTLVNLSVKIVAPIYVYELPHEITCYSSTSVTFGKTVYPIVGTL